MTLPPEVLQQRYAAIELAYSEQNWNQAETLSQALLKEVPDGAGDPLRQRLLLLLGHTRLYGMADTAAARQHYGTVLEQSEEPTLREIAEQGLEQCLALEQPATATTADEAAATHASDDGAAMPWLQQLGEDGGTASPMGSAKAGGDATPWLQPETASAPLTAATQPMAAGELSTAGSSGNRLPVDPAAAAPIEPVEEPSSAPTLAAEIVEEPEQIAVAQADPQRREELELQEPLVLGTRALNTEDDTSLPLIAVGANRGGQDTPPADTAPLGEALIEKFSHNLLRLRLS